MKENTLYDKKSLKTVLGKLLISENWQKTPDFGGFNISKGLTHLKP